MQHFFQSPAKGKQHESEQYADQHYAPFPGAARHSNAGSQPSAGCRSQSMDLFAFIGADNHPGAQKANAGQDALDDAAYSTHIVTIGNAKTATAEPSPTSPSVRTPVGLPCRSRLSPNAAPATTAAATRRFS